MTDDRNFSAEELENWKPGDSQESECRFDCEEEDEQSDCCTCCW